MMALKHLPIFVFLSSFLGSSEAAVFSLQNKCRETIWPAILTAAGKPQLMDGGFQLKPNQTIDIIAPKGWSGRLWGRRHCSFDVSGNGMCVTGDCGGKLKCDGVGGAPPATLAEFTLDSPMDFYDLSLVDGYNMPVSIFPSGGSGNMCKAIRCLTNLNKRCPKGLELKNKGRVVGCKSACMAFNKPEYCCSGEFNSPNKCKPTSYSKAFKASCPLAYSYAYDDASSTFTCEGANYLIRFC